MPQFDISAIPARKHFQESSHYANMMKERSAAPIAAAQSAKRRPRRFA